MQNGITKEKFEEWLNYETTREVFVKLKETREEYINSMVNGHTLGNESKTAWTVGVIYGIDSILAMTYE